MHTHTVYIKMLKICHLKMLKAADSGHPYNPAVLLLVHFWDHHTLFDMCEHITCRELFDVCTMCG